MAGEAFWWRSSRCAQVGSEFFFPDLGDNGNEGKSVCARCPVRLRCLIDAIKDEDEVIDSGIFGGFGRGIRRELQDEVRAGHSPRQVAARAIKERRIA